MDASTWLTFFFATLAISVAPGPGALAAMGAGLQHGFARGQPVAFGLALGVVTQLMVVGVGLGALLATSEAAFSVVKWLGAAYLVWLGVQQWRAPPRPLAAMQALGLARRRDLVRKGWMVNSLNPKGTVFLLAVVPQFLRLEQPLAPQYAVIAATLGFTDLVVMAGYTALAAKLLGTLTDPQKIRLLNRVFGGLFVAAGLLLASVQRH